MNKKLNEILFSFIQITLVIFCYQKIIFHCCSTDTLLKGMLYKKRKKERKLLVQIILLDF